MSRYVFLLLMQVLPNGSVWLPALVDRIAEVATGATPSIHVDQKLIDGPNANEKGKWWIPLIILAQVCEIHLFTVDHCLDIFSCCKVPMFFRNGKLPSKKIVVQFSISFFRFFSFYLFSWLIFLSRWCDQYFLIVRPIRSAIEKDLIEEEKQRPQWQIRAEEFVRPTASLYEDDQVDEQAIRQALKQGALNDQMDSFVEDDEDDDEY